MNAATAFRAIAHEEPRAAFLDATHEGLEPYEMADLVTLLRKTAVLPLGLAGVCRDPHLLSMDVCGTGGASGSRLNTSTLTALFLPDFGINVIKHGGRSASGKKGSLDLLESLGLEPAFAFEAAPEHLRAEGLCYLGAGFTYAAFARYAPLRKAAGRPTIFNLLGPLLNPAPLGARLLGCYSLRVQELLARTVEILGEEALLVCSEDSEGFLDEGAPWSVTHVVQVKGGKSARMELAPRLARPARREELFADGVRAALSLLGRAGPDAAGPREEAESAAAMVGFNVALGVLAAHLAEGAAFGNARAAIDAALATFKAGFSERRERASARLSRMSSVTLVHADSPVERTCEQTAGKLSEHSERVTLSKGQHVQIAAPFPWNPTHGFLIAEFKRSTPTRTFSDPLTLAERVLAYERASAFSVVTHPSFGGDVRLLASIRALTDKPILAKDFVRTETEIDALVEAGADGVLVLVDMVGEDRARALAAHVEKCGRVAFVESSFLVPAFGVPMLNSRNLFSLREARPLRDALAATLPAGAPFVVASGVSDPLDARLFASTGGALVVGGALMACPNAEAVRAWIKNATTRGVLKACGAQSEADARAALDAGADLVGVNLIPHSKRLIEPAALNALLDSCRADFALLARLVFLTDAHSDARAVARVDALLASVPDHARALEQGYFAPRLAHARGRIAAARAGLAPRLSGLRAVVLDGALPGSGVAEPYPALPAGAPRFPTLCAGGVTPQTAAARLAEARAAGHAACGLDAASGVENRTEDGSRQGFSAKKIALLARILKGNTP